MIWDWSEHLLGAKGVLVSPHVTSLPRSPQVTDANFDAILSKSKDPLFLEFYAPWCGHCKALAPKWKNVASELKGRVRVGAVNCDENRETCGKYGVYRSRP